MARESTFMNMVITLFAVCLGASALLGGIYALTKDPIEAAKIAKINGAIAGVVPEFDNKPSEEAFEMNIDGKNIKVYPAKKDGDIVGYAIETSTNKGFSGAIMLMVGIDAQGRIYNTSVIAHAETPGLGDKMDVSKSDFPLQFKGKHPDSFKLLVKKDGGDVDAITASTITSRAFCDAVQNAYNVYEKIEGGETNE